MSQNQESISASSSSTQSRPGSHRDEPGRGGSAKSADEERTLTSEAQQVASDLADKATRTAERQFSGGKERAVQVIGQVAEALRHSGQTLASSTDMPMVKDYLGRAASKIDGLSGYLQRKSLTDVVGDVEQFARREPALFTGGALLLGLLGGRFLRSSQPNGSASSGNGGQGARARR
jgi:hypothetical protein